MSETTTRRRFLRGRRKCMLQHRGRDGAVPAYTFSGLASIPKRSPQLNVCDYALWTEINKRMRRQERRWPAGKKETRAAYLKRLRLTALRLPKAFINKSISNMRVRCKRLLAARGRHFEEGGE